MRRRAFLLASVLALPPLLAFPPGAHALTARLLTLEELVGYSTYVVVATAGEHRSLWEDLPSGKRIVTYTRIAVERPVVGAPGPELWVRTLGGAVDNIGQSVSGEAQLVTGSRAMLFLTQANGVVVVTAMSQGHYPIVVAEKGAERLASSPETGLLLGRPGPSISARDRLLGAAVGDAAALVEQTRRAHDERSDRAAALAAGLALGLGATLAASAAHAYCRTSSCNQGMAHTAAVCDPPRPDDCGTVIAWAQPCVEFSVQQDGSPKRNISFTQTEQVMAEAFGTWMGADCASGGHPHILVTEGTPAVCATHEYNQDAGNANVVMYHDDKWPYEGQPGTTLALTTVTYTLDTGEIYDADMELDSADNAFTLGDTNVMFDLLSIVTHESGHFLGMAHSHDPNATMWPDYLPGTISLRHLSPDDVAGICAVYPPAGAVTDCDPTPRHGFSPLCAADQSSGSSSCSRPARPASRSAAAQAAPAPPAGALAVLGAWLLTARRRRRDATRARERAPG